MLQFGEFDPNTKILKFVDISVETSVIKKVLKKHFSETKTILL